jgi:hypothetical protein
MIIHMFVGTTENSRQILIPEISPQAVDQDDTHAHAWYVPSKLPFYINDIFGFKVCTQWSPGSCRYSTDNNV